MIANDFGSFLLHHQRIHTIFFNGQKAATLYGHLVLPGLPAPLQALNYVILPSSSPAHAAVPFSVKLRRWTAVPHASRKVPPGHPILEPP